MTRWKYTWGRAAALKSTAAVVEDTLSNHSGSGVAERALELSEQIAAALGRLAETLEDKGVLTTREVQTIFEVYAYEPVEDEA